MCNPFQAYTSLPILPIGESESRYLGKGRGIYKKTNLTVRRHNNERITLHLQSKRWNTQWMGKWVVWHPCQVSKCNSPSPVELEAKEETQNENNHSHSQIHACLNHYLCTCCGGNGMKRALSITLVVTVSTLSLLFISYFVVYAIMSVTPQENAIRVENTVKAVCDNANNLSTSKDAWNDCYKAENASNTEYICDSSNQCHVEEDK